jgi:hypothetical protein
VIRVYDAGNVIETHDHTGDFALLRLMAPLNAIARQVLAYFYAIDITAALIHLKVAERMSFVRHSASEGVSISTHPPLLST